MGIHAEACTTYAFNVHVQRARFFTSLPLHFFTDYYMIIAFTGSSRSPICCLHIAE